ncbi:GntR family transcriptional regulator [Tessaracoccus sp. G1721]
MSVAPRQVLHAEAQRVPVTLDRESPIPLYHQLYEQLAAAILDGTLSPGERFEQELSLADRLGLSRLTIRRTMGELVNHGLLVRGRGVGTVVAHRSMEQRHGLGSLHDDLAAAGHNPSTRLLSMVYPSHDVRVTTLLKVGTKTPLLAVERLRLADGAPLAILRNWLPPSASAVRFTDLEQHGLYATMRRHGIHPQLATQSIGSRRATPQEREALEIGRFDPVLTLTRLSFNEVGQPVEYAEHTFRGDRYELDLTVRAGSPVDPS